MSRNQQDPNSTLAASSMEDGRGALFLYEERECRYRVEAEQAKKAMDLWSHWRLLLFIGAFIGVFWTVRQHQAIGALIFLVGGIAAFVAAVIRHHHHIRRHDRARLLQQVNVEGIWRCRGEWTQRENMAGDEFIDKSHAYASDLDLFGAKSLYQWFNTARTSAGRQTIASWLKDPSVLQGVALKELQESIRELSCKLDWRQQLEAEGLSVQDEDLEKLFVWAERGIEIKPGNAAANWLRYAPGLTILVWLLVWWSREPLLSVIGMGMLALQVLVAQWLSRTLHDEMEAALKWEDELATCRKLLDQVTKESFESGLNQQTVQRLQAHGEVPAAEVLKRLETLLSWMSVRNNPIVHFLFNNLFWWDWQCMRAVRSWQREHGCRLRGWMEEFAKLEARCSLSVIHFEHPDWVFPEVDEGGSPPMLAEQLGHPLLPDERRVCNDFAIACSGSVTILTGSNMSGKSTFLRTVGVNLVLALIGAPVCAGKFVFTPMELFSSMRIADDMNSGVSSFYAELLRIKMIVDAARAGRRMLFLVDEIFRGTNSGDRVIGAMEILRSLSKTQAVGLVSTHDLELSRLEQENPQRFSNAHFSERFKPEGMEFDYTLQPGPATTTNARQLIRMVGIEA